MSFSRNGMLHIINKSPLSSRNLHSCLRFAQSGDVLLLIEDGVYAATEGSGMEPEILKACAHLRIHALKPDIEARGMTSRVLNGIHLVDYGGFVDLAAQQTTSHTWL